VKTWDVVIAGAGSVGLPLAWQLAVKGFKVAVIDQEASWGRGQNRAAIGGIRATHSASLTVGSAKILSPSTARFMGLTRAGSRGQATAVSMTKPTRLRLPKGASARHPSCTGFSSLLRYQ